MSSISPQTAALTPPGSRPAASPLEPTWDGFHAASPSSPSDSSLGTPAKVALVAGSQPHPTSETELLLASRLRSAALVMLAGFSLYFAWMVVSGEYARLGWNSPLVILHVVVDVVLAAISFLLCTRCPRWVGWLRLVELIQFGLPALFLAAFREVRIAECCRTEDVHLLASQFQRASSPWLILMFTYAVFIPNTWRRAAVAVGAIAVQPVLLSLWDLQHPFLVRVMGSAEVIELGVIMFVGAFAAVAGVYTIGHLRQEAFEARQLGQYRLKQLLGAGGMGEVYLAEHQLLKRPCAIKVVRPGQSHDPRMLARFEREVRSAARLSHWNSIEIFDYGHTADGTFYYVMEYLPGMDLGRLVEQFGPLPPERVIHLLEQTCQALAEAHAMGLVHRDLKPTNLFAAQRGGVADVAKLLDFGLVKDLGPQEATHLTQEGTIAGSPAFMSPEQALGDPRPDPRGDIYSLGAVAYFLLTGHPPFEDARPLKVLFAHAHDPPPPLSQWNADLPEDLEQVVLRCLAKEPQARFADVQELRHALLACSAAGRWTHAHAAAWWEAHGESAAAAEPAGVA